MADRTRGRKKISDEVLDELLAGQDAAEVFRSGTLIDDLKKAVAERALDAEMEAHLEREGEVDAGNHRNGHNRKRVLTDSGAMDLEVPRDRLGRFEPQLVEKYARRLPGFDDKVVSMYARGMSTREIQGHVRELYGLDVSPELVSKVTDAVHDEIREWQARPLDDVYAIVYFDAVRAKVRDEGLVRNKAVYLGIGVTCAGRKEVLGLWIEQTEGARFWFAVMNELKARGLQDVLIAVVDGLKGFPEAIESVYPEATVQTCIVHLIRHSLAYAGWKERKALASALKAVYQAPTEAAAAAALDAFEAGPWGRKYPGIVRSWRSAWDRVVPFFAFSAPIRRAIYTTNAIESLNSTVRRAVRARGHFPTDRAASKLIYLALRGVERKWRAPPPYWHTARREFAIAFGDRFSLEGA
ncbi:MAG: IS256 family transposase [Gemmatimonadetes bacterium]|nr:IS256 family transposase [Gemmatimonadota bacterium]